MLFQQTTTLKDLRSKLSEYISMIAFSQARQDVVITRFGKPVAALLKYEEYQRLMNPANNFSKKKWERGFKFIDKARKATEKVNPQHLQKTVNQVIKDVRHQDA